MPITFQSEASIQAPPARVMAAMTDLDGWSRWMQGLERVEKLTEGPYGVGTRWRETRRMFGKEASEVFEVTGYDPPRRIDLFVDGAQGSTGKGVYRYRYSLEPAPGEATLLKLDGEIDIPGTAARLLGFVFKGMFRKGCERDNAALKAYVEGSGAASPTPPT